VTKRGRINPLTGVKMWAYNNKTMECQMWREPAYPDKEPCGIENTMSWADFSPPKCECDRIYKSVGKEDIIKAYGHSSINRAGGNWYSHPAEGECKGD
jgi:hypothetical protein